MTKHTIRNESGTVYFKTLGIGAFFYKGDIKHIKVPVVKAATGIGFSNCTAIIESQDGNPIKFNNVNLPPLTPVRPIKHPEVAHLETIMVTMFTMIQKAHQHLDGNINQVIQAGGNPAIFLQLKKILTIVKENEL